MCSDKITYILCYVLLSFLQLTQAVSLRCYYGSLEQYESTPLHEPLGIMSCINRGLQTVVYTFGYKGRPEGSGTSTMLNAYISKGKRNVILLDWTEEASTGMFAIPLGYALIAVPNSRKIGRALGDALMKITASGVNLEDIQLVGHSLGAQVMGYAGRRVKEYGKVITRITGLDPAGPFFEGGFGPQSLDHTCARFVDIVHTDPGGYGMSTGTGTVDIWPNYSKNNSIQPGCRIGSFELLTTEDICSHDRSWQFFAEAIAEPTSFPCAAAKNYKEWIAENGEVKQKIYLGDLTNMSAKGNFFLNTRAHYPFALGAKGMKPDDNQIRAIRNYNY